MDFFIKNGSEMLRLPVPPPDFTIQAGNQIQSVTVTNIGEISLWGPEKLATIALGSFFPYYYNRTYCSYESFPKPWDCVNLLNKWRLNGNPIRLIITDKVKGVDINMEMFIETFEYKMQDASGDVYFTLAFRQYKKITIPQETASATIIEPIRSTPPSSPSYSSSSSSSSSVRKYTVVSGDCLWNIAKRFYGNGSKYMTIKNANSIIKDPALIYPGWVLVIP